MREFSEEERRRQPPGQHLTERWPVLHEGSPLDFDPSSWSLRVHGAVSSPCTMSWEEFCALPMVELVSDFHCVTSWSRLDMRFQGPRFRDFAEKVGVLDRCTHVRFADHQGYDTSVPLEVAMDEDVLLATHANGEPLSAEHGGPMRNIIPKRYAWKMCKWCVEIEFLEGDRLGFWEQRGYHNEADPWQEQRFSGEY